MAIEWFEKQLLALIYPQVSLSHCRIDDLSTRHEKVRVKKIQQNIDKPSSHT